MITGDSIIQNILSRSLNWTLKEYFSVVTPFSGAKTQDMAYYIKPSIAQKPDMVILQAGTNNFRSDQIPSHITNRINKVANNKARNGTEVVASS